MGEHNATRRTRLYNWLEAACNPTSDDFAPTSSKEHTEIRAKHSDSDFPSEDETVSHKQRHVRAGDRSSKRGNYYDDVDTDDCQSILSDNSSSESVQTTEFVTSNDDSQDSGASFILESDEEDESIDAEPSDSESDSSGLDSLLESTDESEDGSADYSPARTSSLETSSSDGEQPASQSSSLTTGLQEEMKTFSLHS